MHRKTSQRPINWLEASRFTFHLARSLTLALIAILAFTLTLNPTVNITSTSTLPSPWTSLPPLLRPSLRIFQPPSSHRHSVVGLQVFGRDKSIWLCAGSPAEKKMVGATANRHSCMHIYPNIHMHTHALSPSLSLFLSLSHTTHTHTHTHTSGWTRSMKS